MVTLSRVQKYANKTKSYLHSTFVYKTGKNKEYFHQILKWL